MQKHRPDCGCSRHREPERVTTQPESMTLGREYHPTVPRQMGWAVNGPIATTYFMEREIDGVMHRVQIWNPNFAVKIWSE